MPTEKAYKNCCVLNSEGDYQNYVLVHLEPGEDGGTVERIDSYILKPGEKLIEASPPSSMIAPRWTGTDWEETGTRTITPEDLEQLRTGKLQMANTAAQQAIHAGVTVGDNTFALTEVDQINITAMAAQLQAAMRGEESTIDPAKGVPYHADGELCRYWPAEEFAVIAQAATAYAFYHQTYCNHLRQYIKDITDYDELEAVHYGMGLPPELATSIAQLLGVQEG